MIDPRFLELEKIGFVNEYGENFEYYFYKKNNISLISSALDEDFKVYLEMANSYWTDIDDIKSMIQFINQAEVD